jgi:hypothetical protein
MGVVGSKINVVLVQFKLLDQLVMLNLGVFGKLTSVRMIHAVKIMGLPHASQLVNVDGVFLLNV